jgi:integrase
MTKIRLPYIHEFIDRHSKVRRYARLPGRKRVPLPGAPGTTEFMDAYQTALAGREASRPAIGAARVVPGSTSAAVAAYYQDASFRALAPSSQQMRRRILEHFRTEYGGHRIALLQRSHIAALVGAQTPSVAKNWLKTIRGLMQFLIASEQRQDDPTVGLKPPKVRAGEIHSWTEQEIAAFEAHHGIGTRARLAMALLLYTAQRRSDVVRMGRQHVRSGVLIVRQQKTGRVLEIPIHPKLG